MAIERFDLLVDDPAGVFAWLEQEAGKSVVRKIAYETVMGWHMKIVLDDPTIATAFRTRWETMFATSSRLQSVMNRLTRAVLN